MGILRGTADTIEVNATASISEDLGAVRKLRYKVTFKRRGRQATENIIADMNDPDSPTTVATILSDDLVSWRDLEGEGGEVEYNMENLSAMVDHPEYCKSLFDAWGLAQVGRLSAKAKN